MAVKTIKTDQRIFEVTNYNGDVYLCNLGHFNIDAKGNLFGAENEPILKIRHYWNNSLKKTSKKAVVSMINPYINKLQGITVIAQNTQGFVFGIDSQTAQPVYIEGNYQTTVISDTSDKYHDWITPILKSLNPQRETTKTA